MLRKVLIKLWYTHTVLLLAYWDTFPLIGDILQKLLAWFFPYLFTAYVHTCLGTVYNLELPHGSPNILSLDVEYFWVFQAYFIYGKSCFCFFLCMYNLFVRYLDPRLVCPMGNLGRHLLYQIPWMLPSTSLNL